MIVEILGVLAPSTASLRWRFYFIQEFIIHEW